MFGIRCRREREAELRAEAERLIAEHGVSGALAVAVERFYANYVDPEARDRAGALRTAIKAVAGLGSLDTATRYHLLNEREPAAAVQQRCVFSALAGLHAPAPQGRAVFSEQSLGVGLTGRCPNLSCALVRSGPRGHTGWGWAQSPPTPKTRTGPAAPEIRRATQALILERRNARAQSQLNPRILRKFPASASCIFSVKCLTHSSASPAAGRDNVVLSPRSLELASGKSGVIARIQLVTFVLSTPVPKSPASANAGSLLCVFPTS